MGQNCLERPYTSHWLSYLGYASIFRILFRILILLFPPNSALFMRYIVCFNGLFTLARLPKWLPRPRMQSVIPSPISATFCSEAATLRHLAPETAVGTPLPNATTPTLARLSAASDLRVALVCTRTQGAELILYLHTAIKYRLMNFNENPLLQEMYFNI